MPVIPITTDAEPYDDELIPEDTIHTAKLLSIKPRDISWTKDGEKKNATLLNWRWEIVEGQFKGRSVFLTTNSDLDLNRKFNRFRNVVETLVGREMKPEDPPFDTDDIIEMVAEVSIKHRPDKRDPEKKYVEVDEVLPAGDTVFVVNDDPPF